MQVVNSTFFIFSCINRLLAPDVDQKGFSIALNYDGILEFPVIRYNSGPGLSKRPIFEKPHSYIIQVSASQLNELMFDLLRTTSYNTKANFIFVQEELNINLLSLIAHHYLINVVTIDAKNGTLKKYVDDKFEDFGTCSDDQLKYAALKERKLSYGSTYKVCFFKMFPLNICHPISSKCKRKGVILDIIDMAFKSLNLSVEFVETIFANIDRKDVFANMPCRMVIVRTPFENYDFTESILQDPLIWIVRTPSKKPRWTLAFSIFDKEIWFYWFSSTILISFIWFIVEYVLEGKLKLATVYMIIKDVLILFLDQISKFATAYTSESLLKCLIVVSTFTMNMFYKAKFAYLLTGFEYEQRVTSLKEIINANMKFAFPSSYLYYFSDDSSFKYIKTHYEECTHGTCLRKVAKETDLVVIHSEMRFLHEFGNYLDIDGKPLLHRLHNVVTNHYTLLLFKGHPLTPYLNIQIRLLRENGLTTFIKHHTYKSRFKENFYTVCVEKLDMSTIKFPFQLWILGNLLAILIFLKELLNAYLQR